MKKYLLYPPVLVILFLFSNLFLYSQENKIPLDHSIYDSWKIISNARISNDGNWVTYEINPAKGDGYLYLYDVKQNTIDSIERGYAPVFSNQFDFMAFKIRPQYATLRQAKKEKIKKEEMPKDSLGIWLLDGSSDPVKYPNVQSVKVPADGSGWLAFHHHEQPDTTKADTTVTDTTAARKSKKKIPGSDLVIINPVRQKIFRYEHVVNYDISRQGTAIGFLQESDDTIPVCTVSFFNSESEKKLSVFEAPGKVPA